MVKIPMCDLHCTLHCSPKKRFTAFRRTAGAFVGQTLSHERFRDAVQERKFIVSEPQQNFR